MPARATSSATISFGLVSIPIKVYAASQSKSVRFNMLDQRDKSRIKQQYVNANSGDPVAREEIVKGYEYARGQYVVLEDDDKARLQGWAVVDNVSGEDWKDIRAGAGAVQSPVVKLEDVRWMSDSTPMLAWFEALPGPGAAVLSSPEPVARSGYDPERSAPFNHAINVFGTGVPR